MTPTPSPYEQRAWDALGQHRPRRASSRGAESVAERVSVAYQAAGEHSRWVGSKVPQVGHAIDVVRQKAGAVGNHVPDAVKDGGARTVVAVKRVGEGANRFVNRTATATLSPARVVKAHRRKGFASDGTPVESLEDLRALDLERIDAVRPRGLDLVYAAASGAVGAASGFVITGSELTITASGGAAAAPGGGTIVAAMAGDAAVTASLCARAVGHVAMYYGYDPTRPDEKIFHLAILDAGTAVSASAKAAAYSDLSHLTQMLYRGKPWRALNETVTARIANAFMKQFNLRLTQKGLGKVVPVAGIVAGASLNWLTLEQVVDAADATYRRRFLMEKYPAHYGSDELTVPRDDIADASDGDVRISVVEILGGLGVDEADQSPTQSS